MGLARSQDNQSFVASNERCVSDHCHGDALCHGQKGPLDAVLGRT